MTVTLEPPLTRSFPQLGSRVRHEALATAPRYLRTGGMGRWHRPRSGERITHPGSLGSWTVYRTWCGQSVFDHGGDVLAADTVPAGQLACGTCEGRAAGAGQDDWPGTTELIFSPRRLARPKQCPGSRKEDLAQWVNMRQNILCCMVCGDLVKGRVSGGPYNPRFGSENHEPGDGLVQGCPFHAWDHLVVTVDKQVACLCQCEIAEETGVGKT